MSERVRREDEVYDAEPADEPRRKRRDCPCCGCRDFVKLGHQLHSIQYLPLGTEGQFLAPIRNAPVNLRVCLDCGFVGCFVRPDALDKLRDQRD
jgi:hypothetical protein